jgi:hypothetical protein
MHGSHTFIPRRVVLRSVLASLHLLLLHRGLTHLHLHGIVKHARVSTKSFRRHRPSVGEMMTVEVES